MEIVTPVFFDMFAVGILLIINPSKMWAEDIVYLFNVKTQILQRISKTSGITEATKSYVLEVSEHDANYVT